MKVSGKKNDELKKIIQKAIEARKIVRKRMNELFDKAWTMKSGKCRLDWIISESKEELGRRKSKKCKAWTPVPATYGGTNYSCRARELSFNFFSSPKALHRKYCCTCKWTPAQAQTRMVIIRIKNGKAVSR